MPDSTCANPVTSADQNAQHTMTDNDVDMTHPLYKSDEGYEEIMKWYHGLLEQIEVPFEQRFVDTRFGKTHMLVCGPEDGEPLVLVQAVAGSSPLWRNQLADFSKHFRVYALDTVGQPGLSDQNPPSYLNDDYTQWLCDVLDSLKIEKAHFAGVSAGGWQVMRMAIDAPDRVRKAVLLSPMGVCHAKLPVKIWLTKMVKKGKDVDGLQDDLTAKSVKSKSPGGSFGTFDRQLARAMALCTKHFRVDRSMGIYNPDTGKVNKLNALRVLRKFFLSEPKSVLRQLMTPTLVIFGQHEVLYNPYKVGPRLKKLAANVDVEVIEGAGHAVIYDRPNDANPMIIDFLRAP